MIAQRKSRICFVASVVFPVLCAGQTAKTVYTNPRAAADDPRIGLKSGLYDAGEAASGLEKIASLPKPPGFAPGNVIPMPANAMPPVPEGPAAADAPPRPNPNQYGSTNSDLAFSANHLFVGNYNGINFYDIDSPMKVKLRASLVCPGGQGDVSVYGHLLFMSAEAYNGRTDCGTQGIALPEGYKPPPPPPAPPAPATPAVAGAEPPRIPRPAPPPSPDRFRGVRIFDISDMGNPKQVAAVQSCADRIRIRCLLTRRTRTTFTSIFPEPGMSGNRRSSKDARGAILSPTLTRRCPNRHNQGAAGASVTGEDRKQPAHFRRCSDWCVEWPLERRQARGRHAEHL